MKIRLKILIEPSCGTTIASIIKNKEYFKGKKVGIIDLTRGELGTRGSAEIRTKETKEAVPPAYTMPKIKK